MEFIYQLISLFKRWSSYIGLANKQNFEDIFYNLLHDKNYDEALRLAQQHEYLDIDLVYKCKWRNSSITVQSINCVLAKIQDKLWAINECVQIVPISYEACRRLIEFGLEESNLKLLYRLGDEPGYGSSYDDKHGGKLKKRQQSRREKQPLLDDDVDEEILENSIDFSNLNDEQKELCRCRQNLIRYDHYLTCYETILGDHKMIQRNFDHVFYDELRQKCPLEVCITYANDGDPHAVETCLNFFTQDLKSHLLAILSNFPETLSPYQYRNLLPCVRQGETEFEWRSSTTRIIKNDWSRRDSSSNVELIQKEKTETYTDNFYSENQDLKKYLKPFTADLLSEWYTNRALDMESRTLLVSNPIQLLNLGLELNIKKLQKTRQDLMEFGRIIYDYCTDNNIYLSFTEFNRLVQTGDIIMITNDFCNNEAKYSVLSYTLTKCHDPSGKITAKILNHIIELRKRDERIHLAYIQRNSY